MQPTGIFIAELLTPWDCPQLQELHLSYLRGQRSDCFLDTCTCHTRNGSIALADVHAFVTSSLRCSAERLSKLVLSGFLTIVDPEPGLALLTLQQVSREIKVHEQAPESLLALRASAARHGTGPAGLAYAATDVFDCSGQTPVFGTDEWDELAIS